MIQLYYYAEKMNYIVAGTTNKAEVIQGFYVKFGDGGVDTEPIAHLYKTQVYQLARHLGVIDEIISRSPSPDTYSLPVTDKQFYFCLDYELLDLLLYAYENNVPLDQISNTLGLREEQIQRAFKDKISFKSCYVRIFYFFIFKFTFENNFSLIGKMFRNNFPFLNFS